MFVTRWATGLLSPSRLAVRRSLRHRRDRTAEWLEVVDDIIGEQLAEAVERTLVDEMAVLGEQPVDGESSIGPEISSAPSCRGRNVDCVQVSPGPAFDSCRLLGPTPQTGRCPSRS